MKKEDLLGRYVYGFKFPDGYAGLTYVDLMNHFRGKIGRIESVDRSTVKIVFPDSEDSHRNFWYYPKSMVLECLVTEALEKKEHEIFKIL